MLMKFADQTQNETISGAIETKCCHNVVWCGVTVSSREAYRMNLVNIHSTSTVLLKVFMNEMNHFVCFEHLPLIITSNLVAVSTVLLVRAWAPSCARFDGL
jgi:hypothetical protein